MKYEEMNDIFFKKFPQLEHLNDCDYHQSGSHALYGMLLNPYVAELLKKNDDFETIKGVFNFYEELAQSDDQEVVNLLQVTLLEYLWDDKAVFDTAKRYMQPSTLLVNKRIKKYLREP